MKFLQQLSFIVVMSLFSGSVSWGQEPLGFDAKELTIDTLHGVLHTTIRSVPPLRVRLGNENIRDIYESCSRAPIAVVANATSVVGEGV